jgi:hypothetical protein
MRRKGDGKRAKEKLIKIWLFESLDLIKKKGLDTQNSLLSSFQGLKT